MEVDRKNLNTSCKTERKEGIEDNDKKEKDEERRESIFTDFKLRM